MSFNPPDDSIDDAGGDDQAAFLTYVLGLFDEDSPHDGRDAALLQEFGFKNWSQGVKYYNDFQPVESRRTGVDVRSREAFGAAVRAAQAKGVWYVILAALKNVEQDRNAHSVGVLFGSAAARVGLMSMTVMDLALEYFDTMQRLDAGVYRERLANLGSLCDRALNHLVELNHRLTYYRLNHRDASSERQIRMEANRLISGLKVLCLTARLNPPKLGSLLNSTVGRLQARGSVMGGSAYYRRMLRFLNELCNGSDEYGAKLARELDGPALEQERLAGLLYGAGAGHLARPDTSKVLLADRMPSNGFPARAAGRLRAYAWNALRSHSAAGNDALVARSSAWLLSLGPHHPRGRPGERHADIGGMRRRTADQLQILGRFLDKGRAANAPVRVLLEQLWRAVIAGDVF